MPNELTVSKSQEGDVLANAVMDLVLHVPPTREQAVEHPALRAREIGRHAARSASMTAGSLALPPGLLGWLTVLPEMMAVWKIQAQMVSDIAGVYGQSHTLGREQMLYCLFKQVSAQLLRDLAVRVGERVLLQKLSSQALQALAKKLGVQLTQNILKKGASRLVPLIGAIGVGAYAYADTMQVAKNAVSLFESLTVTESTEK